MKFRQQPEHLNQIPYLSLVKYIVVGPNERQNSIIKKKEAILRGRTPTTKLYDKSDFDLTLSFVDDAVSFRITLNFSLYPYT